MPSFYPRQMPRQHPLTPPEFVPSFGSSGCGYQSAFPNAQQGIDNHETGRFDTTQRFGQSSAAAAPQSMYMYPQYTSAATLPSSQVYYEPIGAPLLPPMRLPYQAGLEQMDYPQSRQQEHLAQLKQQPQKEEKPIGGVSAKLDYDIETMTDFVCEMALGMYELLTSRICIADIDIARSIVPGRSVRTEYRKWVHQVLTSTRLPSATLLLSLSYLAIRTRMLSSAGRFHQQDPNAEYRMLTIALVLGSKFLDDNTFVNRSWCDVSGFKIGEINSMEKEWLEALDWNLHRDPAEPQGFASWSSHWTDYQRQKAVAPTAQPDKLAPINTNIQRLPSMHSAFSPPAYSNGFRKQSVPAYENHQPAHLTASTYAPSFDPWSARSANENSPMSAPHSGPTTPEYYATSSSAWVPGGEGYSRRTMFGFAPLSHSQPPGQPHFNASAYGTHALPPQYYETFWNGHGSHCNCTYCARQHPPYFMTASYGAQTVMG